MVTGNSEGVGVSNAKDFKGTYEAKLELPEKVGSGSQTKNLKW